MSTPRQISSRSSYAEWRHISQELARLGLSIEQKKSVMLLVYQMLDGHRAFGSSQMADWSEESLRQFLMDESLEVV